MLKNLNDIPYRYRQSLELLSQDVIYHPVQFAIFNDNIRFKVISAGRRSGKTFTAKRKLVYEALTKPGRYFCADPTAPQARAIFWEDMKLYFPDFLLANKPNETRMEIDLKNGSKICIVGLDQPQRFEGQPWTGGIIDEADDIKEGAWNKNIRPALDTLGLNTWVILCGVPNGKYLLFDLSKNADGIEWQFYHWKSAEILPAKAIAAAKRDLSPLEFRQEYEASFETAKGIVYSDYSSILNKSTMTLNTDKPIQWTHDFNYTPLSSAIIQDDKKGNNHVVDEIVLTSAVAKNTALEFVDRYKNHKCKRVYLFGDYSGVSGEKHNQSSDYKVIEEILRKNGWDVSRHVKANPQIKQGQNALRARICNCDKERRFYVNINKCKYVDNGLSRVQLKNGSTFQEEETEYQHITTALRYWAYTRYKLQGNSNHGTQSDF